MHRAAASRAEGCRAIAQLRRAPQACIGYTPCISAPCACSYQAQRPGAGDAEWAADAAILSEYQLWPHGYVAAATLRASRRALAMLAVPHTFDALVAATGANAGHLQVALRTLRALGWVTLSDAGVYAAPPATLAAACCAALGALCVAVYSDAPGMVARLAAQPSAVAGQQAETPSVAGVSVPVR